MPLLRLLFAIAMESLAGLLQPVMGSWGIVLQDTNHMVTLYDDDMLIYLLQPVYFVPMQPNLLWVFGEVLGLRVKPHKSKLFPLGQMTDMPADGLPWVEITWALMATQCPATQ
ncbi:hypothetical protein NDU88_007797 [Pleurodeles waltl]|uniref:Uncharacterized protein n=1 Tax=Pleurodeles waltl TaxID=8319 RepID=A0AAV7VTV6_PLEWA|nr:hypothetical protein NDU88_007797 [Pleurodeles waltl]